jgi:outer membrane protein assembly factor BamB
MRTRIASLIVLAALTAWPVLSQEKPANNWPVFRGDSLQTGVAHATLPDALALRWSVKSQNIIEGNPIIYDQTVYVGSSEGKLLALDLATGQKKWEYATGAGILAAPAARDGAVYVGDVKGVFHCVEAATGKPRWSVPTQGKTLCAANFGPDKIIFGSYDFHLYCVTPEGKIAWQCKTKEKVHGTPAIAGNRVLVGGCDQSLHVIDLDKGQEVTAIALNGHCGASAAVRGDHVYLGNMANKFLAIDWKKGAIQWEFEAKRGAQAFLSSAAVTDEVVVAGSRDKHVRAWQRQTGMELWAFATKGRVDSSPIIAGQRVVVTSLSGQLHVLDLARGAEVAQFELNGPPSSPAVSGPSIVVTTVRGEIYCYGGK